MGGCDVAANESDTFIRLLTECQGRLYSYIMAILPDSVAAHEVLSETNVKLWRKWSEFQMDKDFAVWAFRFAYFEVLAYQKRRRTDRHIFQGDLLDEIAKDAAPASQDVNEKLVALGKCIEKLSCDDRKLINLRYQSGVSVQEMASSRGKTPNAISHALFRIRSALAGCIERTLKMGYTE